MAKAMKKNSKNTCLCGFDLEIAFVVNFNDDLMYVVCPKCDRQYLYYIINNKLFFKLFTGW